MMCVGMFTTDAESQMSWFTPLSLEPLYKFELIGLIFSLAVYNGLTLPVNFPLALYRKLLNLPLTRLEHISDGWPSLAKGLQDLLDWSDGDVEQTIAQSYGFSVEAFGKTVAVDSDQIGDDGDWPSFQRYCREPSPTDFQDESTSSPFESLKYRQTTTDQPCKASSVGSSSEGPRTPRSSISSQTSGSSQSSCMVTNANRGLYVEDYIYWLTDKSIRPQYEAFARGFHVCIEPKAISIFSPEALKRVVEGTQDIDVEELLRTATYEGDYYQYHRVIQDFWHVVREFSAEELRQLLAFVTSSDRIPVGGISTIDFIIQSHGTGDDVSCHIDHNLEKIPLSSFFFYFFLFCPVKGNKYLFANFIPKTAPPNKLHLLQSSLPPGIFLASHSGRETTHCYCKLYRVWISLRGKW